MNNFESIRKDCPIRQVVKDLGYEVPEGNKSFNIKCPNKQAHNNEDATPSLTILPDVNRFLCQVCEIKGSNIDLVILCKGCTLQEAVLFIKPDFEFSGKEFHPVDSQAYWQSRGLTQKTQQHFDLTLTPDYLSIPIGNYIKRRNFKNPPKFYYVPEGAEKIIFKTAEVNPTKKSVMLVESELCAMKLWQESGYGGAIWALGGKSLKSEWLQYFEGINKIYLCLDTDKWGKLAAYQIAATLGKARCFNAAVPAGKDPTEFFVKYNQTFEDFTRIIKNAQSYIEITDPSNPEGIMDFGELTTEEILTDPPVQETIDLGIEKLSSLQIPPGFHIILANKGTGKSWMSLHIALKSYLNYGKHTVIFTLEDSPNKYKHRALQAWSKLTRKQYGAGADRKEGVDLLRESKLVLYPFGIEKPAERTPTILGYQIEKYYSKGYRIFHLDYFQKISGIEDGKSYQQIQQEWTDIIGILRKKYPDIWLFGYSQVNRDAVRQQKILREVDARCLIKITDAADMIISINKVDERYREKHSVSASYRILNLCKNKVTDLEAESELWGIYLSKTGNYVEDEFEDRQHDEVVIPNNTEDSLNSQPQMNTDNKFDNLV